eukprot:354718-Chlamydomonas_euryale.AAC.4
MIPVIGTPIPVIGTLIPVTVTLIPVIGTLIPGTLSRRLEAPRAHPAERREGLVCKEVCVLQVGRWPGGVSEGTVDDW